LLVSYSTCPYTYVKDIFSRTIDDEIILVTKKEDRYEVRSLQLKPQLQDMRIDSVKLFGTPDGNEWLAVWSLEEFFLYNLCTRQQTARWKGRLDEDFAFIWLSTTQCTLCFLGMRDWIFNVNVFNFVTTSGEFSLIESFDVHNGQKNSGEMDIVALTKSQIFIDLNYGAGGAQQKSLICTAQDYSKHTMTP